jgi:hypothetical protein
MNNNSNDSSALLIIIIAILLMGVGPFLEMVGTAILFLGVGAIAILIVLPFGILIEKIKENRNKKKNWKWRGSGNRYARYVMHVEEVAYRFCLTHPKKDKNKIMEIVRKRRPYITKQGVVYKF